MRLLLDTHIWLWLLLEPDRLSTRVWGALEDGSNELWLSPISIWEALLLADRARVELGGSPSDWIRYALGEIPVRDAGLNREVAIASRSLDLPHEDPADRFIAASAIVHELTLVTADEQLARSKEYEVLANR